MSVLRPAKIHGPGCRRPREWAVIKRVLDGRDALLLPGGGITREATTSTLNLAKAVAACAERPGARVINVADAEAASVGEKVSAILASMRQLGWLDREIRLVASPEGGPGRLPWFADKQLSVAAFSGLLHDAPFSYGETVGREVEWVFDVIQHEAPGWALPEWAGRAFFDGAFDYAAEDAQFALLRG